MNRAGSQKLIDKRRKMKDTKGAEFAMRVSQESWKGQRKPVGGPPRRVPIASPANVVRQVQGVPAPTPGSRGPPPHRGFLHPAYMGAPPHQMMGHIGYSPMGGPAVTPGFAPPPRMERPVVPRPPPPPRSMSRPPPPTSGPTAHRPPKRVAEEITPPPKSRGVRIEFDAASSRKKRRRGGGEEEMFAYFGKSVAKQPKTTALAIMSYLSNDDLYKAALVNKSWSRLAMDEELWKFE